MPLPQRKWKRELSTSLLRFALSNRWKKELEEMEEGDSSLVAEILSLCR